MKSVTKFFVLSIVMIAFSAVTFGQVSATANATALVLEPLTISATTPLDFGSFASAGAGTVIVAQNDARTNTGGVFLIGGTPTAAVFDITCESGRTIDLALPGLPITLTGSVSGTMNITAISSSHAAGTQTLTGGAITLRIGATLAVGAAQASGTYTNATDFTVQINYN